MSTLDRLQRWAILSPSESPLLLLLPFSTLLVNVENLSTSDRGRDLIGSGERALEFSDTGSLVPGGAVCAPLRWDWTRVGAERDAVPIPALSARLPQQRRSRASDKSIGLSSLTVSIAVVGAASSILIAHPPLIFLRQT